VARAVDAGFDPKHIVLLGISGWMNPRTEIEYCHEHGITVVWIEDIEEHGVPWAVEKALAVTAGSDEIRPRLSAFSHMRHRIACACSLGETVCACIAQGAIASWADS
jgi:hypothetical protein